jgi:hypothetical protein
MDLAGFLKSTVLGHCRAEGRWFGGHLISKPACIQINRASVTFQQGFCGQANAENLVYVFFVNPGRREPVHRRLEDAQRL